MQIPWKGGGNNIGSSIAVDASGNVYVAGRFAGTIDFDPSAAIANHTSFGSSVFIAKYDASGDYMYANVMGGGSSYGGTGVFIAVGASGNVYVTGGFRDTVDFDPSAATANLISAGGSDIFIAKYDASGNYMYANAMGGTSYDQGNSIAVDASGNVYVTGGFLDTVDFDPSAATANLISPGGTDIFIAKYDASGNYMYANAVGVSNNDVRTSIAVDASGNVYLTGFFRDTVDFDPSAATANLISAGGTDIFIAKYDASGNYMYANAMGNSNDDKGTSIAVDASGSVHVTGQFQDTVDFDPSAATANLISAGQNDIFIAKYDASGNHLYANAVGGSYNDRRPSIFVDAPGSVHVVGSFAGIVDFDPSAATANLTPPGYPVIFIAKYSQWVTGILNSAYAFESFEVFPNPTTGQIQVTGSAFTSETVFTLIDSQGRIVKDITLNPSRTIDMQDLSVGHYTLTTIDKENHTIYGAPIILTK